MINKVCFIAIAIVVSLSLFGCKKEAEHKAAPGSIESPGSAARPPEPAPVVVQPIAPTEAPPPPEPAAPAPITSDEAYTEQGLALLTKLVDVFKASGSDCDKLAADVTKLAHDNAGYLQTGSAYEKAHPTIEKRFAKAAKSVMKELEAAAGAPMQACSENKQLTEALSKLQ